jgi:hypothetical protein
MGAFSVSFYAGILLARISHPPQTYVRLLFLQCGSVLCQLFMFTKYSQLHTFFLSITVVIIVLSLFHIQRQLQLISTLHNAKY